MRVQVAQIVSETVRASSQVSSVYQNVLRNESVRSRHRLWLGRFWMHGLIGIPADSKQKFPAVLTTISRDGRELFAMPTDHDAGTNLDGSFHAKARSGTRRVFPGRSSADPLACRILP